MPERITPEQAPPHRSKGDRVRLALQALHDGDTPTVVYERWNHRGQRLDLDKIQATDFATLNTSDLHELQTSLNRDRIFYRQFVDALLGHIQLESLDTLATVAASDASWGELHNLVHTREPHAAESPYVKESLADYPHPAQDFLTTYGYLNAFAHTRALDHLVERDPGTIDLFVDTQYSAYYTHCAIRDIADILIERSPSLQREILTLDDALARGELTDVTHAQAFAKATGISPRVTLFNPRDKLDKEVIRQTMRLTAVAPRIANARSVYATIFGWRSLLNRRGVPPENLPRELLEHYIADIGDESRVTLTYLRFYASDIHHDLEDAVIEHDKTLTTTDENHIIVASPTGEGARRGMCPVQHHITPDKRSAASNAAATLEACAKEQHNANLSLANNNGAVRIADLYATTAILFAARPGGLLDPANGHIE